MTLQVLWALPALTTLQVLRLLQVLTVASTIEVAITNDVASTYTALLISNYVRALYCARIFTGSCAKFCDAKNASFSAPFCNAKKVKIFAEKMHKRARDLNSKSCKKNDNNQFAKVHTLYLSQTPQTVSV